MSQARRWRCVRFRAFLLIATAAAAAIVTANPGNCGSPTTLNGFPASSEFFPLGVWQQQPRTAAEYKAVGINTFVGLWEGPTEVQLAELAPSGLYVVAAQNKVGLTSPNRGVIKGWMQADEPDNAQAPVSGLAPYSPCIPAAEVARRSQALKARDPTRPVLVNFGRGVADPLWLGRGSCTGDEQYYDIAAKGADIVGFDIYPVGSDTPRVKGKLEYVARGVVNLLRRTRPGQSVWSAIETTALDPARPVKPAEMRAEVWMALIHGARGIVYFAHEWAGGLREDGIFRHPEIVREVAQTNHTIGSLAPALNSPDRPARVSLAAPAPIATMVKEQRDRLYLFAVAMENRPTTVRFAIAGLSDAEASVLDEGRSVAIKDGILEDGFEGYAVHLYKIALGPSAHERAAE